jgi:hypothetical protein
MFFSIRILANTRFIGIGVSEQVCLMRKRVFGRVSGFLQELVHGLVHGWSSLRPSALINMTFVSIHAYIWEYAILLVLLTNCIYLLACLLRFAVMRNTSEGYGVLRIGWGSWIF